MKEGAVWLFVWPRQDGECQLSEYLSVKAATITQSLPLLMSTPGFNGRFHRGLMTADWRDRHRLRQVWGRMAIIKQRGSRWTGRTASFT